MHFLVLTKFVLFQKFASVSSYLLRKLALSGPDLKQLTWEQFLALFSCAVSRPEIDDIYAKYVHGGNYLWCASLIVLQSSISPNGQKC